MAKTLLCALLFCLIATIAAPAQSRTNVVPSLLKQLLDLPAPPPVNRDSESEFDEVVDQRPESFYETKNVPPDDAPIEILLDYWARQNSSFDEFRYNFRPSKEVLRRLRDAIEKSPQILPAYMKLFETSAENADFVKKLYEQKKQDEEGFSNWFDTIRRWLRNNSDMFVDELLAEVREIKEENGRLANQEDMIALAKVDWDTAKPFVDVLERSTRHSATQTLAKYVLYHRALREENSGDADKYRAELKAIVEDKTAGYKARDLAMDALVLGGDFEGRDDWYVSLLSDETLLELQENGYTGLTTLIRYMPTERERWIPLMTKLLSGNNITLRTAAVRNLYHLNGFNKEIAMLLLPWLSNPEWAGESGDSERDKLIQFIGENDMPESVPGLIQIVMSEEGYVRSLAAKALVRYESPAAIPALRIALGNEDDDDYRDNIIEALLVSGGISDGEGVAGLEAYAVSIANKKADSENESENEEDENIDESASIEIKIGVFLKRYSEPRDSLVSMTLQRIKALKKTNPKVADILSGIVQSWRSRIVDLEMLELANGAKADVSIILKILIRRDEMRERIPNELSLMRDKSPMLGALSAVISENISAQAYMLSAGDVESRIALLALARLVRAKLPVQQVGTLLASSDMTLALAAERYLESEDSVDARRLILSRRKGEARILGAQNAFVIDGKKNYDGYHELLRDLFNDVSSVNFLPLDLTELNKTENDLRAEFKTSADLLAVYAFIQNAESGQKVLRVYKDKIVFTFYEDGARFWEKHITPGEYEAMYNFLVENRVDEIAPAIGDDPDYDSYEFVMFGRDGGRRIFYRQYSTPDSLKGLEEIFDSFNTGERRLRYWIADKIPGVEVLLSSDKFAARAFWKNGGDLRVLVEDVEKEKNILEEIEQQEKTEDANENLNYAQRVEIQRNRRAQLAYKHYSWRKLENASIGDEVAQPADIEYLSENMQVLAWSGKYIYQVTPRTFRRRAENFVIRADSFYFTNLIKVFDSGATVVFKEGNYASPMVSPDGKWIVAGKREESSSRINSVVRINLQTGKEIAVNIPPANEFRPIAFADAHNKMLLARAKGEDNSDDDSGPKTPEYYLLDVNTGAFQLVKGEFRPLADQTFRGLQPTGNPNEFWAAIHDDKANATRIGFYDARLFAFKPVLELPKIEIDSMDIFVDKSAAKLYFIYGGHLLALPFAAAQNQP